MPQRQIILDTETTGLYATGDNPDRIIEFAGLEMVNRQFTGRNLHLYIHPQRDIPEEAIAIHGLTLEKLKDKPTFQQVAQTIFDFLKDAELIIHNAKFDIGFLNAEFERVNLPTIERICSYIDTLEMARHLYPGQKNSLDALCTRLDIDRSRRTLHGALIDCELLGEVYLAMTRNQFSLIDDVKTQVNNKHQIIQRPAYLKIQPALPQEINEHESYLDTLDKIIGGKCLYRNH